MFAQRHRLNSRCFEELLKKGKFTYHKSFKLIWEDAPDLKIAVVVPKKVARLSVTRHKFKRIVVNLLKTIINLPKKGSYIVFVQKNIKDLPKEEVSSELNSLFECVKL